MGTAYGAVTLLTLTLIMLLSPVSCRHGFTLGAGYMHCLLALKRFRYGEAPYLTLDVDAFKVNGRINEVQFLSRI